MSDFIQSTPDRPLNWTLASEPKIKTDPSLSQLWDEWRATKTWEASGRIDTKRANTYFEMQEEPQL